MNLSYLICPQCLTAIDSNAPCQHYIIVNGKLFFTDKVKETLSVKQNAKVRSRWTIWRENSFEFFENNLANANTSSVVVDLGVGEDQLATITDRFPNTIGVDFEPYPAADIITDITKPLPFKSDAIDYILASNVLEHLPDLRTVMIECVRILKPGGKLIATTPFLLIGHQRPYDFSRYTDIMLEQTALRCGFSGVEVTPLTTPYETSRQFMLHYFSTVALKKLSLPLKILRFAIIKCLALSNWLTKQVPRPEYTGGFGVSATK